MNAALSSILTLATPGVAADSNGVFHPLGEHAETSFSVDRQPISDQQSRIFSNQISASTERRGRNLHDPRIHFAVNCASASCPKLQPFAYTAAELDHQLDRVTRDFFGDSGRGLRLERNENTIFLSPILKWNAGDFNGATTATGQFLSYARAAVSGNNVLDFVLGYVSQDVATYIHQKRPTVKYLDYNWTLNSQKLHSHGQ